MCIYLHRNVFITLLLLCQYRLLEARGILFSSDITLDIQTRRYNNLVMIISSNQNKNNCKQLLTELQVIPFRETSILFEKLFSSLTGWKTIVKSLICNISTDRTTLRQILVLSFDRTSIK